MVGGYQDSVVAIAIQRFDQRADNLLIDLLQGYISAQDVKQVLRGR